MAWLMIPVYVLGLLLAIGCAIFMISGVAMYYHLCFHEDQTGWFEFVLACLTLPWQLVAAMSLICLIVFGGIIWALQGYCASIRRYP